MGVPNSPSPAPVKQRATKQTKAIVGGVVAAAAGVLLLASVGSASGSGAEAEPTPAPSATVAPPATPEAALEKALADDLGNINRDDEGKALTAVEHSEGTLTVTYRMNDNLFGDDSIIGYGWNEVGWIIEDVQASDLDLERLEIVGTSERDDKHGNGSR